MKSEIADTVIAVLNFLLRHEWLLGMIAIVVPIWVILVAVSIVYLHIKSRDHRELRHHLEPLTASFFFGWLFIPFMVVAIIVRTGHSIYRGVKFSRKVPESR